MSLLLALAVAHGAETACDPLDELSFRDLLLQLQAGIDRGDLELSHEVVDEVHTRVPCLTFAPQPRQWAAYLVGEAIVRFAREEPWEASMASALRLYPAVDRGVSSRHPLAEWEPPDPLPPGPVLPDDSGVWVDGLPAERLPARKEVHLVQRTDGRFWNSLLVEPGSPLPPGWAAERVEQPPRMVSWFGLDAGLGLGSVTQQPSFDSDWVQTIPSGDRTSVAISGTAQGAVTFYSPFGLYGRGTVWTWAASPGLDAHVAGIWTFRGLMLGAGGGTASVDEFQGPRTGSTLAQKVPESAESHRVFMLRYGAGMVHLKAGQATRWHGGLLLGGAPAVTRGLFELHMAQPPQRDGGRWRVSLTAGFTRGVLQEQRRPDNDLAVSSARAALHIGRVWGEY